MPKHFELGKEYRYSMIEDMNGLIATIQDVGPFLEGQNFLVVIEGEVVDPGDAIASFVLTGTAGGEGVYRCCYVGDDE